MHQIFFEEIPFVTRKNILNFCQQYPAQDFPQNEKFWRAAEQKKNINLILIMIMDSEIDKEVSMVEERIQRLQGMLFDQQTALMQKVHKSCQQILQSKKYKKYESILKRRVVVTENFIAAVANTQFRMLSDEQFLLLTTETDVIQKVEKFKKSVFNSLQKITQNLQNDPEKRERSSLNEDKGEEDDEMDQQFSRKPSSTDRRKSKNFKISIDASMKMIEWLLINFERPYPSMSQKQEMATSGNISLTKVNNWFINARERTVKGYFSREN